MSTNQLDKAQVFKSWKQTVQFHSSKLGIIAFKNHEFLTRDARVVKFLEDHVLTDVGTGVYRDPNDMERDQELAGSNAQLRAQQLNEFLAQQTQRIDAGTSTQTTLGVTSTAGNPLAGGKGAAAPHFQGVPNTAAGSNEEVSISAADALKARLAAASAANNQSNTAGGPGDNSGTADKVFGE